MSLDETLQSYEPAVAFLRRVTGARLVCGSQSLALPLAIPSLLLLLLLLLSRRVHVTSLVRSTPTPTQRSNLTTGILVVIALPVHSCLILEDCCVYSRPLLLSVCISLQLRTLARSLLLLASLRCSPPLFVVPSVRSDRDPSRLLLPRVL